MRILMVALPYHGYSERIADEFRAMGHEVRLHEVQPRDFLTKAIRVPAPALWQARMNAHHASILRQEAGQRYDIVLFIQCHQLSAGNMAAFRRQFAGARFLLYNWDSISNHDYLPHLGSFDEVFTFDPEDARRHGLKHLPLFCSREFQSLQRRNQHLNGVYFVGNIVSQARYEAIDSFRQYCAANAVSLNAYLACTPVVAARLWRAGVKPTGLSYGPIAHERFLDIMANATTVFDFANHVQTGYTMRIFENLCARKKIITSNRRIQAEPFYTPDRIHVFDGMDFSGVKAFLETPLEDADADFPEFHIQAFARHLMDGTQHPLPPESAGQHRG